MNAVRKIIPWVALIYLLVGLLASSAMGRAIPAINNLGKLYIIATWPGHINGVPTWMKASVPCWAFSFNGKPACPVLVLRAPLPGEAP